MASYKLVNDVTEREYEFETVEDAYAAYDEEGNTDWCVTDENGTGVNRGVDLTTEKVRYYTVDAEGKEHAI